MRLSTAACPRCHQPVPAGSRYCASCGADARTMQEQAPTLGVLPPPRGQEELLGLLRAATRGEFEVMSELGRGGMATVFLARDPALGRNVAIKVMSPALVYGDGMVERFKREARTAGGLSHPHIIPIHAVRETPELLFFVMSFVEGRSLDAILKEVGRLPIRMVQAILTQVGSALFHAHRHHVVHRDIKPGNIMLDEEGFAVVTDFGIAKVEHLSQLTQDGSAVGTPYYMSPEQCAGQTVGSASDQYSLGVVGYEMLTGRVPFQRGSVLDIMRAHFTDPPPPIASLRPDCPVALARAVERMLAKEPAERFLSMDAAVHAIGALAPDDPIRTQMVELAKSGSRPLDRPRQPTPARPKAVIPGRRSGRARRPRWTLPVGIGVMALVSGWIVVLAASRLRARLAPQGPAAAGQLVLASRQQGTTLILNGDTVGTIGPEPRTFTVPAGRVTLRVEHTRCRPKLVVLEVRSGQIRNYGTLDPVCELR